MQGLSEMAQEPGVNPGQSHYGVGDHQEGRHDVSCDPQARKDGLRKQTWHFFWGN